MFSEKKFYIAGVQHHNLHKVLNDTEEGMEICLIPEPSNKFDPNAVRIEDEEGTMLGYVPRKFSSEVSAALEVGTDLTCLITKLNKTAKPWEMCEVSIKEYEDKEEEEEEEDEDEKSGFSYSDDEEL